METDLKLKIIFLVLFGIYTGNSIYMSIQVKTFTSEIKKLYKSPFLEKLSYDYLNVSESLSNDYNHTEKAFSRIYSDYLKSVDGISEFYNDMIDVINNIEQQIDDNIPSVGDSMKDVGKDYENIKKAFSKIYKAFDNDLYNDITKVGETLSDDYKYLVDNYLYD
jgi:hypothetical protein